MSEPPVERATSCRQHWLLDCCSRRGCVTVPASPVTNRPGAPKSLVAGEFEKLARAPTSAWASKWWVTSDLKSKKKKKNRASCDLSDGPPRGPAVFDPATPGLANPGLALPPVSQVQLQILGRLWYPKNLYRCKLQIHFWSPDGEGSKANAGDR